jgi:sRNA-binding protein
MDRIHQLRADLRAALLAGEDTNGIRKAIAQAEADHRAEAERQAQAAAKREAAEAARIRSIAETIAADATARLSATLAPLQPPPAPWGVG